MIVTAMNTAIAVVQKRVHMPSSTQTAPTVSMAITISTRRELTEKFGMPPWTRSRPRLRNTPPTASRMKNAAYGANEFTRSPLEHGHREERPQIVVRHAQPRGQEPHDRPQDLVGDVTVEVEEELEVGTGDRDQGARGIRDRIGRPLRTIENRHFPEARSRFQHGERFFTGAGNGPRDPDFAFGDQEEPVARFPFLEDVLADGELLFAAHFCDPGQLALVEILEDGRLLEQLDIHGGEGTTRDNTGQVKPWVTSADIVTALRFPLAILFPLVRSPAWQLVIVAAAAASDVADGFLARRVGASRAGAVLDPVADKVFMVVAFVTIARRGLLSWYELIGVLLRDILAVLGFLATWLLHRPLALPLGPAARRSRSSSCSPWWRPS